VGYFFQGLPKIAGGKTNGQSFAGEAIAFLATKDGLRLMQAMTKLPEAVRRDMTTHIVTVAAAL
jgi:hypothetical protein